MFHRLLAMLDARRERRQQAQHAEHVRAVEAARYAECPDEAGYEWGMRIVCRGRVGVFLAGAGTGAGAPVSLRLSLSRIPTATLYTCEYLKITEFAKGSPYPIDPTPPSQADLGRLRHLRGIGEEYERNLRGIR